MLKSVHFRKIRIWIMAQSKNRKSYPFATGLHTPIGISIDRINGKLYVSDPYVDSLSGSLWKSNLDGSDAERIATTVLPLGIFFVNNEG